MAENVVLNVAFTNVKRGSLALEDNLVLPISMTELRVHDNLSSILPSTAAADDLGLVTGAFGTNSYKLESIDFGGTTTTAYARFLKTIPENWQQGLQVRIHSAMDTTVADSNADIDVEAYKSDKEYGVGSDLVVTAQQSMNSLSWSDYSFALDTSGINVGDELDIRIKFTGTDVGNLGVMKGMIGSIALVMGVRG